MFNIAAVLLVATVLGAGILVRNPAFLAKRFHGTPERLMRPASLGFFVFCISLITAVEGMDVTATQVLRIMLFQVPGHVEEMLYVYAMCLTLIIPWRWMVVFTAWVKRVAGKTHD
jgi:hypothetical protein